MWSTSFLHDPDILKHDHTSILDFYPTEISPKKKGCQIQINLFGGGGGGRGMEKLYSFYFANDKYFIYQY